MPKIAICDSVTESEASSPRAKDDLPPLTLLPVVLGLDTKLSEEHLANVSPPCQWNPQPFAISRLRNGRFSSNMCTWYFNEGVKPRSLSEEAFDWNIQPVTK